MGEKTKFLEYIKQKISRQASYCQFSYVKSGSFSTGVSATVAGDNYPLGINTWRIVDDGCHEDYYYAQLGLSVFNESLFMCHDGRSVHMDQR